MGLKDFEITFDNDNKTYSSGETVNGQVKFTLTSDERIRGVFIQFCGEAKTYWSEYKHKRAIRLKGQRNYFNIKNSLVGSYSTEIMILRSGSHTYDFTCVLPQGLPSTFEGEFGYIRYTVKVTMDRPWKYNRITKSAFTVISNVDLNLHMDLQQPLKREISKTSSWMSYKSGPLSMTVSMPVTGFISGQKIQMLITVDNGMLVNITQIILVLRKIVTFFSHTPECKSREKKHTIVKVFGGTIKAGTTATIVGYIPIPPVTPSNLTSCGIIDLDYEIKVKLQATKVHTVLDMKIPIVLGKIPFNYCQDPVARPCEDMLPPHRPDVVFSQRESQFQRQYSLPPPTYNECQFRTKSIKDESASTVCFNST